LRGSTIYLIANADDFNITEGVSRGILDAHDRGIVTSTSVMINLAMPRWAIREIKRREALGVGLHLNITFGEPVSVRRAVPSLVGDDGQFRRGTDLDLSTLRSDEVAREYENQIRHFRKIFGRLPTHLDTHHHLHESRPVFRVLVQLASRFGFPIRLSRWCTQGVRRRLRARGIRLADRLWEDLKPDDAWNEKTLLGVLMRMRPGVNELMCHPGRCDEALRAASSFSRERERELRALCSGAVKRWVFERGIRLIHFGALRAGAWGRKFGWEAES
jgi:predicted glycoside hydrolase/deacetylase ChbG (UPF0249 family)